MTIHNCTCPDCEADRKCPRPHGDGANFLWQQEQTCWKCGQEFTAQNRVQYLCPACIEEEEDYYHRREDAAFPICAAGGC